MFQSSNNGSIVDPIYYIDPQSYNNNRCFFNSKHGEEPLLSFFQWPSSPILNPCYDELEFFHHQNRDLILQQQPTMVDSENTTTTTNNNVPKDQIPRKRCSNRDRHSKINTAQGPRDRRMRLSLKVAREFFDLQDKLCFDKASKTVEWLLIQARPAINQLCGANYSCSFGDKMSASSTSECEVVSGIDEEAAAIKGSNKPKSSSCVGNNKPKKAKPSRKIAFHPLAKESREKARARARERTREKQWCRRIDESSIKLCEDAKNNDQVNQFSCWSPFETAEESATQNPNSLEMIAEVEAPMTSRSVTNETMIDDSLVISGKWSPSSIMNHLYNSGFPPEHQITEFQSFCKPWDEGFNC